MGLVPLQSYIRINIRLTPQVNTTPSERMIWTIGIHTFRSTLPKCLNQEEGIVLLQPFPLVSMENIWLYKTFAKSLPVIMKWLNTWKSPINDRKIYPRFIGYILGLITSLNENSLTLRLIVFYGFGVKGYLKYWNM